MSSPKDADRNSPSTISTGDLVKEVVESGLHARYEDAVQLVGRGDEAVPCLSKYLHEDKFWHADENGNFIADSYAPISALHLLGAIGSIDGLEEVIYTLYERSDDLEDWLTEDVPSVLTSFGSKALRRCKECALDKRLDLYSRHACVRAMAMIASRETGFRPEIVDSLKLLILRKHEGHELIAFTICSLAELKEQSALEAIKEAYRRNKVETGIITLNDVLKLYGEEDEKNSQYHFDEKKPLDFFLEPNLEKLRKSYSEWLSEIKRRKEGKEITPMKDLEEAETLLDTFDEAGSTLVVPKVGRNYPCPCGSGSKYKKCCLPLQIQRKRWDPLEEKLRRHIQEFYDNERFMGDYDQAMSLYGISFGDEDIRERRLFHDWLVHDYIIPSEKMSIIRIFIKERGNALYEQEAKTVSAWANSTFRFLEVLEVRRGVGFDAKDIFSPECSQFFVYDASISISIEKEDILFARPYPLGTIIRLGGGGLAIIKERQKEIEEYVNSNYERFKVDTIKGKKRDGFQSDASVSLDDYFRTESLSIIKYLQHMLD